MRRVTLAARRAQDYFRRPPRPRWLQPVRRAAAVAAVAGLVAGGAWWIVRADLIPRAGAALAAELVDWSAATGLVLGEVYVDGRVRTDMSALRRALDLDTGRPLLGIDLAATKVALERLPWVEQAIVSRMLPGTVRVQLLEREPLALWQRNGDFVLIDRRGRPIQGARGDAAGVEEHRHLRVLVGDDAPRLAARLFALLSTEPELWARVVAATRVGKRRWSLRLDNRVEVLLPEDDLLAAWRFLAEKVREDRLLDRAVSVVDLRFLPGRLRLRLAPEALEERRA